MNINGTKQNATISHKNGMIVVTSAALNITSKSMKIPQSLGSITSITYKNGHILSTLMSSSINKQKEFGKLAIIDTNNTDHQISYLELEGCYAPNLVTTSKDGNTIIVVCGGEGDLDNVYYNDLSDSIIFIDATKWMIMNMSQKLHIKSESIHYSPTKATTNFVFKISGKELVIYQAFIDGVKGIQTDLFQQLGSTLIHHSLVDIDRDYIFIVSEHNKHVKVYRFNDFTKLINFHPSQASKRLLLPIPPSAEHEKCCRMKIRGINQDCQCDADLMQQLLQNNVIELVAQNIPEAGVSSVATTAHFVAEPGCYADQQGVLGTIRVDSLVEQSIGSDPTFLEDTIEVQAQPAGTIVAEVKVFLNVSHTWIGDLQVDLTQNGNSNQVWAQQCGNENPIRATFADSHTDSQCSSVTNNGNMSSILGTPYNVYIGTSLSTVTEWTLTMEDVFPSLDDGTWHEWAVILETQRCPELGIINQCSNRIECCGGHLGCDINGACCIVAGFDGCINNADCCGDDTECILNICTEPQCKMMEETCFESCDCCDPLICNSQSECASIQPIAGPCMEDIDCDVGLLCNSFFNQCLPCGHIHNTRGSGAEIKCSTNDDCCAEYVCHREKCRVAPGSSVSLPLTDANPVSTSEQQQVATPLSEQRPCSLQNPEKKKKKKKRKLIEFNNVIQFSSEPNLEISDSRPSTTDTITVPMQEECVVQDVNVYLDIDHTWIGDLVITLTQDGNNNTILDNECSNVDNITALFSDAGDRLCAEPLAGNQSSTESFCAHFETVLSESSTDWTLEIKDTTGLDNGIFNEWELTITCCPTLGTAGLCHTKFDCCGNDDSVCMDTTCCLLDGYPGCDRDIDCCGQDTFCFSGTCSNQCKMEGDNCSTPCECCDEMICNTVDRCAPRGISGDQCMEIFECQDGLICNSVTNTCSSCGHIHNTGRGNRFMRCGSDTDCCSGYVCFKGKCRLAPF